MPYQITSPLPPIFSSQLVKFLSKSLHTLYVICWANPSDSENDLEELLSKQYDQNVKNFYRIEQERVRAEHLEVNNNNTEL